jgi:hypothetical protein
MPGSLTAPSPTNTSTSPPKSITYTATSCPPTPKDRTCSGSVKHQRMLGNGWCQRPAHMDCHYETICETCTYFGTDPDHIPVLTRQRDHAQQHNQPDRVRLYQQLLDNTPTRD